VATDSNFDQLVFLIDFELIQAKRLEDDQYESEGNRVVLKFEWFEGVFEDALLNDIFRLLFNLYTVDHLKFNLGGAVSSFTNHALEVGDTKEIGEEDQILKLNWLFIVQVVDGVAILALSWGRILAQLCELSC